MNLYRAFNSISALDVGVRAVLTAVLGVALYFLFGMSAQAATTTAATAFFFSLLFETVWRVARRPGPPN